jgi:hypothetical protein
VELAINGGRDQGYDDITDSHHEVWQACEPAVAAIARLPVETLDVYAPLGPDLSTYFDNQCHYLQSLRWGLWWFYETSVDMTDATAAFTSALKHISPTPRVSVFQSDLVSRWQGGPEHILRTL